MTQAGLLLLLWDALQQRQTTFGQCSTCLPLVAWMGAVCWPITSTHNLDTDGLGSYAAPSSATAKLPPVANRRARSVPQVSALLWSRPACSGSTPQEGAARQRDIHR